MVLVTASGKAVSMSEIMANSKKAALARLYTMAQGMDGIAVQEGWACAFLTLYAALCIPLKPLQGRKWL